MQIPSQILEILLFESESASLDFKRDQYPFIGANDIQKGELLKDILAFANSWRREDAFILIGIQEVKGGRSQVVGITQHLDDAQLQQFVNEKTQAPIFFSYFTTTIDNVQIGVIHIPVQKRPFFLTRDYGKLKRNIVYIRRGTSTAEAKPDEIAKMGTESLLETKGLPYLDLQFGLYKDKSLYDKSVTLDSTDFKMPGKEEIADYGEKNRKPYYMITDPTIRVNKDYYRQYAEYLREINLTQSIGFAIINESSNIAIDVHVEITIIDDKESFMMFSDNHYPQEPSPNPLQFASIPSKLDLDVEQGGNKYHINLLFGKIQPKQTKWSINKLNIRIQKPCKIQFQAKVFADNLPEPNVFDLSMRFNLAYSEIGLNDLAELCGFQELLS